MDKKRKLATGKHYEVRCQNFVSFRANYNHIILSFRDLCYTKCLHNEQVDSYVKKLSAL